MLNLQLHKISTWSQWFIEVILAYFLFKLAIIMKDWHNPKYSVRIHELGQRDKTIIQ